MRSVREVASKLNGRKKSRHASFCELDTHADTCCAGANCALMEDTGHRVSVAPYNSSYKPMPDIPIATAGTVYDDPDTGTSILLVLHQALWFGSKLEETLVCPNQIRANGHRVDDTPRQFSGQSIHGMMTETESTGQKIFIPFELNGVISRFGTRLPTQEELDGSIDRIILTNEATWKPYSKKHGEAERLLVSERQTNAVGTGDECDRSLSPANVEDESRIVDHALRRHVQLMSTLETTIENLEVMTVGDPDTGEKHFSSQGGDGLYERMLASVHVISAPTEQDVEGYDADRFAFAMSSKDRKHRVTPATLARRWNIGLKSAEATLNATTQEGVVNVIMPGEKRTTRRLNFLRFPRRRLKLYTDTFFAKLKSKRQKTAAQVYTDGLGYDLFYPMRNKSGAEIATTFESVVKCTGVPDTLVSDGAKEEVSGDMAKKCRYYQVTQRVTEPYAPWTDKAEGSVREIKRAIKYHTTRKGSPRRVWCFCGEWTTAIRRLTARDSLDNRTPHENVLGTTPDISIYLLFDWYQVVWYHEPVAQFPFSKKVLGRWLGLATEEYHDVGTFYVLTEKGTYVARKSVWGLSEEDIITPAITDQIKALDLGIASKLGDGIKDDDMDPEIAAEFQAIPLKLFEDDGLDDCDEPEDEGFTAADADERTPEELDEYLTAQVILPRGGEYVKGTVMTRRKDADNLPIGKRNPNPILDTRQYDVQFPDGSTDSYTANLIAENIYAQVDNEGRTMQLLAEIIGHQTVPGKAVKKDDGFTTDKRGRRTLRQTTVGWSMEILWKDHSTSWVALKDLKESNPIEVAEYAVANKLVEEPAFAWWVPHVMKKRDRIINKVKTKFKAKTHKFGIELPMKVADALDIDRRNGATFWRDAIAKEMKNNAVAFNVLENRSEVPVGFKEIKCHMVFDIKMDLTRKARLVAGGHLTDVPKESVYSSVVSRDSVRLAFMIAALNDLDIMSADIQNAYLEAPTTEKVWTECGLEFGTDAGKPALIVRALYGLRSSGRNFRDHCKHTLEAAGFKSCPADPDVYMRKAVKEDGQKYWEYVLMYVDDILVVSHRTQPILDHFMKAYTLKKDSVKPPESYLGADIIQYHLEGDGDLTKIRWAMSSDTYVKRAISEVERELAAVDKRLTNKAKTPLSAGYRPELDMSPELDARRLNYYQGLIGVLRWMCELGRVDLLYSTSIMSSYLASPREGHLEQVLHMFAYLKSHSRSAMVFNDMAPFFDDALFREADWAETYPDAREPMPYNQPEARGMSVQMTAFVDADHAGCQVTRRSHTGYIIYVNKAPILWFSKRQNTVESSTFGSEYVALRLVTDAIEGLRFKLRMMGVPIDGKTSIFCDNESVVKNSTAPESTLKKKHNAVCYHRVREAQATFVRIAHHAGKKNIADIFTKNVPGTTLRTLCARILH